MAYPSMRCFNDLRRWLKTIGLLSALILSGTVTANFVVIANPRFPANQLTKSQLSAIFLGKPLSITPMVEPYNQPDSTEIFQQFYQEILGWNSAQWNRYWSSQIFSGFNQKPPEVNDDQMAIQIVERDPKAIAYVNPRSLDQVGDRVKVIYGHYRMLMYKEPDQGKKLYSSSPTRGYMRAIPDSDQ